MRQISIRRSARVFLFFAFTILALQSGVKAQTPVTMFGVTEDNRLIKFLSSSPQTAGTIGTITGLQSGESILGIDFRPANNQLYALGSTSRLYIINTSTAAARQVGKGSFSTPLSGTQFGFDFNPTVDLIRVVSDTGQNLRVNPNTGLIQGVDPNLNPGTPVVTAAAYTNSFVGAAATTLYDIDTNTDRLLIQNPANAGTLIDVGPLGLDVTGVNGFDISPRSNIAYAAFRTATAATSSLYVINLRNGAATIVDTFISNPVRGIAIQDQPAPLTLFGVTTDNRLVRFFSNAPSAVTVVGQISGLQPNEGIFGIDFRPANGQLYGLGSSGRLYIINLRTAAATQVGSGTFSTALSGSNFGFDFNPMVDRIRLVSDTGQNLRINPDTGAIAATDPNLNPGTPNVTAAAYSNNQPGTPATALYVIDTGNDTLFLQNPANAGTLTSVGQLGIDATSANGFDVAQRDDVGFAVLTPANGAGNSNLYTINLLTGTAINVGAIPGIPLRGLSIALNSPANTTLDYDGDRRADFAVYRNSANTFLIGRSSNNSFFGVPFGLSSDLQTPADYDGDGLTDISVWRDGTFFFQRSSDNTVGTFQWGVRTDEPLPRDYDGDRRADFAVARRENGFVIWYIFNTSNGSSRVEVFGLQSDISAPGDYDGDGKFDLAVKRGIGGEQATFFVQGSAQGFFTQQWGLGSDLAAPGDYDGDGKTDYAVVRQGGDFVWFVLSSRTGNLLATTLGRKPQLPVQNDYDGDGRTDVAVWDPLSGNFFIQRSATNLLTQTNFGQNGDTPIASVFTF